jgi:hypothetical protein
LINLILLNHSKKLHGEFDEMVIEKNKIDEITLWNASRRDGSGRD